LRELRLKLHPAQAAIWNSKARFKVIAAGRRFGKTYLAATALGVAALSTVNIRGHKLTATNPCYYVAPTFDQALRLVRPKLISLLGWENQGGFIVRENQNAGWIELVNGVKIYIKGAENDEALRGEGNRLVVMDEYAGMPAHVWTEILEPTLMDVEGDALFIGTPKGKNHFYKLFMNALKRPESYWSDWEAFHFKSNDNPFILERELARIVSRTQSSDGLSPRDIARQEIEADFVSGGSKILVPSNFTVIPTFDSRTYQFFITVDLAGFTKGDGHKVLKSDESVIAVTGVDQEMWTVARMQHGHWDPRETAYRIVKASKDFPGSRLGIEQGALNAAVRPYLEDYMRQFSRFAHIEELRHHNARKQDRIDWALSGRSERGLIQLLTDSPAGDEEGRIQPWNDWFLDQVADFPDPLAHDDGLDALAYVDQLSTASYFDTTDIEDWVPVDALAGY
jgi:Terminase large subunit, T4likevirus-type, N-terminal